MLMVAVGWTAGVKHIAELTVKARRQSIATRLENECLILYLLRRIGSQTITPADTVYLGDRGVSTYA